MNTTTQPKHTKNLMTSKHDSAYKDFFSHKQVVIDFLRDYVKQPWVQSVDLSSLQRVNSSYVQEADKQRIGDAAWRLRLKNSGDWVYMYLLLEFQSPGSAGVSPAV